MTFKEISGSYDEDDIYNEIIIQPMDQTVIASLKRNYPRLILRTLIQQDDETPTSRKEFLKGYDLKDAFHNIRSSWRCCEKQHTESCLE